VSLRDPGAQELANAGRAVNALPIPWLEPVDITSAVPFLAPNEARYITGVTLPVDAGFLVSRPRTVIRVRRARPARRTGGIAVPGRR
jgi:NAD(P)-dependent dehydrogenase (short-subunit alcohol dehydrogenase family)